jgi:hypothetical protein
MAAIAPAFGRSGKHDASRISRGLFSDINAHNKGDTDKLKHCPEDAR